VKISAGNPEGIHKDLIELDADWAHNGNQIHGSS